MINNINMIRPRRRRCGPTHQQPSGLHHKEVFPSLVFLGALLSGTTTCSSAAFSHQPPCFLPSPSVQRNVPLSPRDSSAQCVRTSRRCVSPSTRHAMSFRGMQRTGSHPKSKWLSLESRRTLVQSAMMSGSSDEDEHEKDSNSSSDFDGLNSNGEINDAFNTHDNEELDDEIDDEEGEEGYDDIKAHLSKISWLPSVRLGKQPYKQTQLFSSRRENKGSFENLDESPPGYQNIEVLPVLPMDMVHGLEGLLNGGDDSLVEFEDGVIRGSYGLGVWEEESSSIISSLGPIFSGTSSYLPHTKGHVFTVSETRYKKMYDDLLRMGSYYGRKRENAMKRAKDKQVSVGDSASQMPGADEKRRFIVTVKNPEEDGVFAEYGLLFQLRDLDEVAAIDDLTEVFGGGGYGDDDEEDESEFIMDALLQTHYEATHDVVGRVKINRFVNPECWDHSPEGEEYLLAEATIVDMVEKNKKKKVKEGRKRILMAENGSGDNFGLEGYQASTSMSTTLEEDANAAAYNDIAKAISRIKDELRSYAGDDLKKQQQGLTSEGIKAELRAALNDVLMSNSKASDKSTPKSRGSIPLSPKGIFVERRPTESLTNEERALRESFSALVSLQHELGEECRFTRISVETFGIGTVGMWLSAAAWSMFVEKRLEASYAEMQFEFQAKLADYLEVKGDMGGKSDLRALFGGKAGEEAKEGEVYEGESIDFEELSPELQREFQLLQSRSGHELGPLAMERAIQMQRIVQAVSYDERLVILRECVDAERKRLEAKKMLHMAFGNDKGNPDKSRSSSVLSREEARAFLEGIMSKKSTQEDRKFDGEDAFQ